MRQRDNAALAEGVAFVRRIFRRNIDQLPREVAGHAGRLVVRFEYPDRRLAELATEQAGRAEQHASLAALHIALYNPGRAHKALTLRIERIELDGLFLIWTVGQRVYRGQHGIQAHECLERIDSLTIRK